MSDIPSDVKILSFDDNTWNDESVSVLNVSNWRSIRNVSIGWNCLESVNHVEARGLGELEAFNVEENSLLNAMSFSIDYSSVVSRKVIVRSMSELNEMSIAVSKLVIGDDSCNELLSEEEEVLNLSRFVNVRRILIGSNALMNVRKVMARGLLNLESLEIGSGSLVNVREFEIDVGSVVRWSYVIRDSVIVDLIPYVVSDLVIADNCCNEVNFTCLDLSRFVNLRSIRIGSNCLNHVRSVLTEGLIHLESLIVGERSLMNAGEIEMSNSVDIEWVYEANDMMSVVNAPSVISKLMIGDDCCNEVNFTSLDLSRFVHLKSLVIGKNSLNHVKNVTTCGVSELKLIEVGENSLVEVNEVDMNEATMINWAFEANSMTSVLNAPSVISKLMIADNCCNEVNFTCLDLSRFVHLKSLVIGKNSLNEIVTIRGVEYELLNEVIIGENSLSSLSHSYTVNNRNTLLSIPWDVTALTVTANSCNDNTINVVDLSSFKFLRRVVIGKDCFKYVQLLSIVGLNWLESVSIGTYSFWVGSSSSLKDSELKIVNCPQLKSLNIGGRSFDRYNGFELSQLPQLKSVVIDSDFSFRYVPNVVFRDLPSLETIDLGSNAFQNTEYVVFENLPKLTVLQLGNYCLVGSTSTKTTDISPYYYKNTLIMRNLPSLTTLSIRYDSVFGNMGFVTLESITFGSIKQ
ncbi:hypothetical protein WA171_000753 [Blastocystis sp. BT1]